MTRRKMSHLGIGDWAFGCRPAPLTPRAWIRHPYRRVKVRGLQPMPNRRFTIQRGWTASRRTRGTGRPHSFAHNFGMHRFAFLRTTPPVIASHRGYFPGTGTGVTGMTPRSITLSGADPSGTVKVWVAVHAWL